MREYDETRFESYVKKRRGFKLWQKIVGSLMCVVVFCTTYAMILPAITQETETYCGYEEHVHEESCYQAAETAPPELICQLEETPAHVHAEECYLPAHTHGEECYVSEQVLVCETAEAEAHVHSAECYATETPLVCGQEESEGHTHGEGCYAETATALTCTLEETEGHTHSEACSTTTGGELICGQEESEEHTHDAACYSETVTTLTCTLAEAEAHAHTDACYTTTGGGLICATEESAGHIHDKTCRGESVETLVCILEETEGHTHSEACYTAGEPVLVCELEERAEAELICTAEDAEGHTHTESCYAVSATEPAEGILVCELEEHTHDLTCHANPNADIENASDWEATFADVELTGVWADDLLAITESQLGYQESTKNYIVLEDGETTKGYTRYGAWYGDPYGDWCAMFVSFCLHYADIPEAAIPQHYNCAQWIEQLSDGAWDLYTSAGSYTPAPGDLIFFDQDGDGLSDHVGLVQVLSADGLTTIEGNSGNRVKTNTYSLTDSTILGYGTLPVNPDQIQIMDQQEGAATEAALLAEEVENKYDLENYIHAVTVQHRADGETVWKDVVDGNVQTGDDLCFTLQYVIPGNTLDGDNRTVIYQLPIATTKEDSGNVYDGETVVGEYHISADGLITITFSEDYAKKNADGSQISGYISFETTVDALETDSKGDVTLPFKQEVTLHVTDKVNNTGDLQVTKTASNVNTTAGTVDYTIIVTSEKGTGDNVTLNDVMTGIELNGNVTIKDKNGNVQNITVNQDGSKLSMELPQMNAGDYYTITYSAKLPDADSLNGTVTANNTVDVQSTDSVGGTLVDDADIDTTFTRDIVSKSGALSEDGSTITWTITVNESKIDIGGWTLSDKLGNSAYTGSVTISPNPGGSGTLTTNLPYTFPAGSKDTYTITYTTTVDTSSMGSSSVSNTATMTPGTGSGVSAGDQVSISGADPLTKKATGVIISGTEDGSKLAEYNWTVTIDASEAAIEPYTQKIDGTTYESVWYYGDELWNEATQWMTGAQIKAMANNLKANYSGRFDIIAYVWTGTGNKYQTAVPLDQVSDTAKYGQFRILFYETLALGQKITFSYASTGNVGDGTASKELTNWGTVNNKVSDQASQSYRPVVTKVDKMDSSSNTTDHNLPDLTITKDNGTYEGVLGWNVKVTLPDVEYDSDVIITEQIPFGTHLLDSASGEWDLSFDNSDFNFNNGKTEASVQKEVGNTKYTVTAKYVDGSYVITIPAELATQKYAGTTITIEVRLQIDEDFNWDEMAESFANTVTVSTGGTELGEATQTQIIRNPAISKTIGTVEKNVVPYSLSINSAGRDLVAGADTLTLTDVLTFPRASGDTVNASLQVDTVKVYSVAADGTKTDITSQCPFTFMEAESGGEASKTITMTIPDSTPLLVEYSYRVTGKTGSSVTLDNTATLEGLGSSLDEDDYEYKVTVEQSTAGAMLKGIKIVKVDKENYSLQLMGATFQLQMWNSSAYADVTTYTTGTDGTISINDLTEDVAYRLIEIDAPEGYLLDPTPYDFYVAGSGTPSLPSDFNGKVLNNGDSVIIANEEAAYTLPETGGIGTIPYTTAGLLTMLGSGILLSRNKRRRKGGSAE